MSWATLSFFFFILALLHNIHHTFPQVQLPYTKRQTQNKCYYAYEHCFWSRGTNCSQNQSTLCSQGPTISINSLSKNIYWAAMFCQILRRPYKIKHEQGIWLALFMPHPLIQRTMDFKNLEKKILESSKIKTWICLCSNYLHAIYIVFTTIYIAFTLLKYSAYGKEYTHEKAQRDDFDTPNKIKYGWSISRMGVCNQSISSVAQSCPTLCDPMNHSTPGLPVHHQLPESTQTHVHWVGDAIQPSHPLSSSSPPALKLSQHQGLFK